jgi:hypothetical protein
VEVRPLLGAARSTVLTRSCERAMAALKKRDRLRWRTPQGKTSGTVQRILIRRSEIVGTELTGSREDPLYVVKSGKTGKIAGHKANALRKVA